MIVYRDDEGEEIADPRVPLAALAARARGLAAAAAGRPMHDEVADILIELGRVEAAVADALFPVADGRAEPAERLREASVAAGRLLRLSWRSAPADDLRRAAHAVAGAIDKVRSVPAPVRLRVPEGYAWYSLYPEAYLEAAEQFAREVRPAEAVCLGLRGIGTSLSAVVAAAIETDGCRVRNLTLRPRGHPFSRRPVVTPELANKLRGDGAATWFLIVDEGPGLSASSFCGTAELLSELGVPDARIVLFPSHLPDPTDFVNEPARERWQRHRKFTATFETAWLPRAHFPPGSRELSGGAWRELLLPDPADWPAVEPRHERRKYLAAGDDGRPVLHKFVGLGRHGARALARARHLADAGFGPPTSGIEAGFLAQTFLPGKPLTRRYAGAEFLAAAGRYVRHLGSAFRLDAPARPELFLAMLLTNVAEGLGDAGLRGLGQLDRHIAGLGEVPAVALDGRMLPHEWVETTEGWRKTDATDHHADHFFPGNTDLAWDVAALADELELDDGTLDGLAAAAGDHHLVRRLPYYRAAYLAFRLGYVATAASSLAGSPDGERFASLVSRYRRRLTAALARLRVALPDDSDAPRFPEGALAPT